LIVSGPGLAISSLALLMAAINAKVSPELTKKMAGTTRSSSASRRGRKSRDEWRSANSPRNSNNRLVRERWEDDKRAKCDMGEAPGDVVVFPGFVIPKYTRL